MFGQTFLKSACFVHVLQVTCSFNHSPIHPKPRPHPHIDRAIAENYDGSRLDAESAKDVARMFGFEHTMLVLANTIKVKSWDERISNDNREWAKTIPIPDESGGNDRHLDYVVDQSHPVLVDAFARQVRHEYLLTQPLTAVDFDNEALRICRQMSALPEPNSPSGTHFMVPLSPDFCARVSSKDTAALQKRLPYPSLALTGMDGRMGVFAVVDQEEDRSRPPRKVRHRAPSVRDKLRILPAGGFAKSEAAGAGREINVLRVSTDVRCHPVFRMCFGAWGGYSPTSNARERHLPFPRVLQVCINTCPACHLPLVCPAIHRR